MCELSHNGEEEGNNHSCDIDVQWIRDLEGMGCLVLKCHKGSFIRSLNHCLVYRTNAESLLVFGFLMRDAMRDMLSYDCDKWCI